MGNNGMDNAEANLIMHAGDIIHSETGAFRSFRVEELLGKGVFGMVVRAKDMATRKKVAVKVIKNKTAYRKQGRIEVSILRSMRQSTESALRGSIVRLLDHFSFKRHVCLVFELLSLNLYELVKQNKFRGLPCKLVQTIMAQVVRAVGAVHAAGIIHCDIKPENILLKSLRSAEVKLIDFGSACYRGQQAFSYIQSRFYRSPEVLLGLPYDDKIDIWSIGCVAAELCLGLPLFPGASVFLQMYRIASLLGVPPTHMLKNSKKSGSFFVEDGQNTYRLKTIQEHAAETKTKPTEPKKYFDASSLDELIKGYPIRVAKSDAAKSNTASASNTAVDAEKKSRMQLLNLLASLLCLDPERRATAAEACAHPFIAGATRAVEENGESAPAASTGPNTPDSPSKALINQDDPRGGATGGGGARAPSRSPELSDQTVFTSRLDPSADVFTPQKPQRQVPPVHALPPRSAAIAIDAKHRRARGVAGTPGAAGSANGHMGTAFMAFSLEMGDSSPSSGNFLNTPLQRTHAHPHSLTLSSTPLTATDDAVLGSQFIPPHLQVAPGQSVLGSSQQLGSSPVRRLQGSPTAHVLSMRRMSLQRPAQTLQGGPRLRGNGRWPPGPPGGTGFRGYSSGVGGSYNGSVDGPEPPWAAFGPPQLGATAAGNSAFWAVDAMGGGPPPPLFQDQLGAQSLAAPTHREGDFPHSWGHRRPHMGKPTRPSRSKNDLPRAVSRLQPPLQHVMVQRGFHPQKGGRKAGGRGRRGGRRHRGRGRRGGGRF